MRSLFRAGSSRLVSLALLLAALGSSGILQAQIAGRVNGSVTDTSGAALPGVTISLREPGSSKPLFTTTTTNEGAFTLLSVPAGKYDLAVEKEGFTTQVLKEVQVDPNRSADVPAIKMDVAKVSTTVEVSSETQNVQTSNAEVTTTITTEQVKN